MKSSKEQPIETMKKCAKIGDTIFSNVCKQLKNKKENNLIKTEIDLANFIKDEIKKSGGTESFPVIVTSGPRAGNDIHPIPTDSKLSGFVIIDFGIKLNGYCSDMTRTVFIGKPNKEDIMLYNVLLEAQNDSIKYFKVNLPVSAPDAYIRGILSQHSNNCDYIWSKDFKIIKNKNKNKDITLNHFFIHTLGHGISKKVHEKPSIFFRSKEIFKKGKVVTNEPGIYIPNKLGIRIEDMYIITDGLPEIITKSKRELLIF